MNTKDQKITELIDLVNTKTACSLDEVKTIVYWTIATYHQRKCVRFPILRLLGVYESGKSDIAKAVNALAWESRYASCKGTTHSAQRDMLNNEGKWGTVVFDEDDKFNLNMFESLFERELAIFRLKDMSKDGRGKTIEKDIYTPLLLAGREVLWDESHQSRTIEIVFHKDLERAAIANGDDEEAKKAITLIPEDVEEYKDFCKEVGESIEWDDVGKYSASRANSLYAPLKVVAEKLGDEDYVEYIALKLVDLAGGQQNDMTYEKGPACVQSVIQLCAQHFERKGYFPKELVQNEVQEYCNNNFFRYPAQPIGIKEVGKHLRNAKFLTVPRQKQMIIIPSAEWLLNTARVVGVENEWLTGFVENEKIKAVYK